MNSNIPKYDLASRIQHSKFDSSFGMQGLRMDRVDKPETQDFKQVMSGLVENLNAEVNAPDNMMKDVMSGSKNVDIHGRLQLCGCIPGNGHQQIALRNDKRCAEH